MRKVLSILAVLLITMLICGAALAASPRKFTQKGYEIEVEYYFVQNDMFMYIHDASDNLLAVGLDNEGCLVYGEWDLETGGVKQVLSEYGEEYVLGVDPAPAASKVFPIPEIAFTAAEERRIAFDKANEIVEEELPADSITFEQYEAFKAQAVAEGVTFVPTSYIPEKQSQIQAFGVASALNLIPQASRDLWDESFNGYPLHPLLPVTADSFAKPWPGGTATSPRGGKSQPAFLLYIMFEGESKLREGAIQLAPSYWNDLMFSDHEWRPYVDERYFRGEIAVPDKFSTTYAILTGNKLTTPTQTMVSMDAGHRATFNAISQDRVALRNAFLTITASMPHTQQNLFAFEHGVYHGSLAHNLWHSTGGRYTIEPAVDPYGRGGIVAVTVSADLNGPIDNAGVQGSFGVSGIPTNLSPLRTAALRAAVNRVDFRRYGTYSASTNIWTVSQAQIAGGLAMTGYSWEFSAEKCVLGRLPGLWGQSASATSVAAQYCPPEYEGAGVSLSTFVATTHCLDEGRAGEGTESDIEYWPTRPRQFVVYAHELAHSTLSITDTYDTGAQQRDLSGASYRYPRYVRENFLANGNIDVVNIPFSGDAAIDPKNWMPGTRYTAAFGNWGVQGISGYVGSINEDLAGRGSGHDGWNLVDRAQLIQPFDLTTSGTYTLRLGEIMKVSAGPNYTPSNGTFAAGGGDYQVFYLSVREDRKYDQVAFDWARSKMLAIQAPTNTTFEGNKVGDNRYSIRSRLARGETIPAYLNDYRTSGSKANESAFHNASGGLLITHIDMLRSQSSGTGANANASYGNYAVNVEAHAYPSGIFTLGNDAPHYPDIHDWGNDSYVSNTPNTVVSFDRYGVSFDMTGKSASKDSHPATQHMIERFSTDRARGQFIGYDVRVNAGDPADLFSQWGVDEFVNPRLFTGESRVTFRNTSAATLANAVWAQSQDVRQALERQRRATGPVVPFAIKNVRYFHNEGGADNPAMVNAMGMVVPYVTFDFEVTSIDLGVTLNNNNLEFLVGETRTLSAVVSPSTYTGSRTITWSSSNTAVATVSSAGVVTGVTMGTTVIRAALASDPTVYAECDVTIRIIPVTGISLDKYSMTILLGSNAQLTAAIIPSNATYRQYSWSSDNPLVATVSTTGLVTSVAPGSAYIKATTIDGFEASCYVTVAIPATGVSISPAAVSLDAGDMYFLTATVFPENVGNPGLVWTSSNEDVVTVTQGGLIRAVGSGRTVTITATAADGSGVYGTATVFVPVVYTTGVTLNKSFLQLLVGGSETLIATVTPTFATSKDVIWSCDSPYVATVDQNGLVTGIGGGPAIITAKTVDGGFEAICNVHVSIPVSSITISPAAVSIDVDEIYWLTATVEPYNAGNVALTWSSSNTAIATVTAVGFVRGIAPGTVTITAAAQDGSGVVGTATVTVLDPYVPVTGVSLSRTYYMFTSLGATMQLTPIITPSNATDQTVTWTSATPGVATVSATGLVTAVSAGSAAITVRTNDNGFTAACNIFVQIGGGADPSDDITPERPVLPPGTPGGIVSSEPIIIIPADSTDISLEADMLATILPGFSSEDFHVNEYGVITLEDWIAMQIAESVLSIYDSEVVMLPVFEAVANNPGDIVAVSFNVKGYHLMVDGLITRAENVRLMMALSSTSGDFFTFTSVPANFDDKMFTILDASNNIYTGEIDPNGDYKVLCFIKDGGDFDLDGQVDGVVWGVMAFVGVPVLGVTLSPDHVMLQIGQTFDFSPGVAFLPPIADNKRITWSSDNEFSATVSPAGVVTATGGGSANITVRTVDNGFTATSNVLVSTPVTSVTIMPPTTSIFVGGMDFLSVTVLPLNATNTNVVWSSSNDTLATVTQGGLVRGVAAGTVTITATAADGSGAFGTCTVTIVP